MVFSWCCSLSGAHNCSLLVSPKETIQKNIISNQFLDMLGKVNEAPLRGEYKLWIYKRIVVPSFHFLLAVDLITKSTVSKLQGCAMKCIKSWLGLYRSTSIAVIHHPDVLGTPMCLAPFTFTIYKPRPNIFFAFHVIL